jgi:CheY-like chemotaxis protein
LLSRRTRELKTASALAGGFQSYVAKPIDRSRLVEVVASAAGLIVRRQAQPAS